MAYRDVLKLKKGDRIKISAGKYGTLTRRPKRSIAYPESVVTIYTDNGTIVTNLPATADVVNE